VQEWHWDNADSASLLHDKTTTAAAAAAAAALIDS